MVWALTCASFKTRRALGLRFIAWLSVTHCTKRTSNGDSAAPRFVILAAYSAVFLIAAAPLPCFAPPQ